MYVRWRFPIKKFLRSLKEIIDNTKEEEASLTEKAKFFVLANEHGYFLTFKQLMRRYGGNLSHLKKKWNWKSSFFWDAKSSDFLKKNQEIRVLAAEIETLKYSFL